MKVAIEYQFRDGPYGGANQFLKTLRNYFEEKGVYTENNEEADVVILNHTNISNGTLELKKKHPEKIFIHRVDGPVSMHRKFTKKLDRQSFYLDKMLCNGTVFQSNWTKENCYRLGYRMTGLDTVIHNAPNPDIFKKKVDQRINHTEHTKTRLVSTSWSANPSKGFDLYQYLDQHLDFSKYDFTFIGRTDTTFKNIKVLPPMNTKNIAIELRKHDLYIAASKSESCSNSLIEALNSGLPAVARDSGCYREIIKDGGIIFTETNDSLRAIETAANDLAAYKKKLPFYHIDDIGGQYYDFIERIRNSVLNREIAAKKITALDILIWKAYNFHIKAYVKITDFYVNHWVEK